MAKKKQKSSLPSWVKSKFFILGVVLVLAVGGVAGYMTFAGSYNTPNKAIVNCINAGSVLTYTNSNHYSVGTCVTAAVTALNRNCKQKPLPATNKYTASVMQRAKGFQQYIYDHRSHNYRVDGIVGYNTWNNLNFYWQATGAHTLDCSY